LDAIRGERLEALIMLALTTGMRQGEILGLQWPDLDLEGGRLSVRRTTIKLKGKMIVGPPKSKQSNRVIELPAMAVDALWSHKARMLAEGHAKVEWVFPGITGKMMFREALRAQFRKMVADTKAPMIRFHDLRHTAATLLLLGGTNPKI